MSKKIIEYKTSIDIALDVIGGKWKVLIISQLTQGPMRTNELIRSTPSINPRMLIQQLKELEVDSIISRKSYNQVPPKVEYSLTDHGRSLIPVIKSLSKWGIVHVEETFPKRSIEYKTMCGFDTLNMPGKKIVKRTKRI